MREGAIPSRSSLLDALDFPDAVALAWRIRRAGCAVQALSCRDDGRLVGWSILFLGLHVDARAYRVQSAAEWEQWRRDH